MIGRLRGIIDHIGADHVILDVHGVGYLVFASANSLRQVAIGEEVRFYTETHVREDHIHLYGFLEHAEQEWFKILNNVNGVGTKMALAILSAYKADQLSSIILSQDKDALKSISGVGPRLADRLLTELKNKVPAPDALEAILPSNSRVAKVTTANAAAQDALSALINLGYERSRVYTIVNGITQEDENISAEDIIKASLKSLTS